MGGEDLTSGALFSYVDMEARIPAKHRLAGAAATDERGPGRTRPSVFGALRSNSDGRRLRRSVCCGRRFCSFSIRSARSASWSSGSSLTFCFAGSLGFPSTRPRVRRLDLLQEPRPLAHPGDCAEVSGLAHRLAGSEAAFERRAFLGRRDFAQGVGVDEEFSAQMVRARRRPAAMARRISARRSGRTRRTPRRRTRMRGCSARAKDRKAVFAISATR